MTAAGQDRRPSVGQVVHYVSYGTPGGEYPSVCRAAIVTEVGEEPPDLPAGFFLPAVGLAVLNPEGIYFNRNVQCGHPAKRLGGTWHWPEQAAPVNE